MNSKKVLDSMKKDVGGIYVIEAISGSRIGWKYVGKATNFYIRKREHFSRLFSKKHHSIKLQRYYDKYGKDSLNFSVLGFYPISELNFWEKWWIKCFDSYKLGFNCTTGGENPPLNYKKCRVANIYSGEILEFNSMVEFARKFKLIESNVSMLLSGKLRSCENWYNPNENSIWKPEFYILIDPNGNKHKIAKLRGHLPKFCKKNNLSYENIYRVASGLSETSLDGWKRIDSRDVSNHLPIPRKNKFI